MTPETLDRGSPLDMHEEVSTPPLSGCARWPRSLRLLSSSGELVMGRCASPNKCAYCARLSSVEWAEMISTDALDGNAPTIFSVLTTGTASLSPRAFYRAREKVVKAVKLRWPDAEYLCIAEYTTGTSARSRGERYPHWNFMWKNVPADQAEDLAAVISSVWCARPDLRADPGAQYSGAIGQVLSLSRYLALHFLKDQQAPPAGWKGHRVTASRGYFTRPRWVVRADAQDSLRGKRELHRVISEGYSGNEAENLTQARLLAARGKSWGLVRIGARSDGSVLVRTLDNREPSWFLRDRVPRLGGAFTGRLAAGELQDVLGCCTVARIDKGRWYRLGSHEGVSSPQPSG